MVIVGIISSIHIVNEMWVPVVDCGSLPSPR